MQEINWKEINKNLTPSEADFAMILNRIETPKPYLILSPYLRYGALVMSVFVIVFGFVLYGEDNNNVVFDDSSLKYSDTMPPSYKSSSRELW